MFTNLNLILYGISILESFEPPNELKVLKKVVLRAKKGIKNPPITHEDHESNIGYLLSVMTMAEKLKNVLPNSDMSDVILNRAIQTVESAIKL